MALASCEREPRSQPAPPPAPRDATPGPVFPERPTQFPACDKAFVPRPERDATPVCYVPGGTFDVVGLGFERRDERERVTLDDFLIDQHEVTVEQYVRFLNETLPPPPCGFDIPYERRHPICASIHMGPPVPFEIKGDRFTVKRGREGVAVHGVSVEYAEQYCAWAGKSVPSREQWDRAGHIDASGVRRRYAWGDDLVVGAMICAEDVCGDGFEEAAPPGSAKDVSPWGVLDLEGNVAEVVRGCETTKCPYAQAGSWFHLEPADRTTYYDQLLTSGAGLRCVSRRGE